MRFLFLLVVSPVARADCASSDDTRLLVSKQVPPLPLQAFIDFAANPSAVRALSLDQTANLGSSCIQVKAATPIKSTARRNPQLVGAWDDGPVARPRPASIASSSYSGNRDAGSSASASSRWAPTPTYAPSQPPAPAARLPPLSQPAPVIQPPSRRESITTLPPITDHRAPPPTPPHSIPSPRPGPPASDRQTDDHRADSEPLLIEKVEPNVAVVPEPAEGELVERVLLPDNCRGTNPDALKQRDTFRLRELRRMTKADKLYSNTL